MRQRLYRRLQRLEADQARLRSIQTAADREADFERAKRKVDLFLRIRGVQQEQTESLFDAFARALGVGTRQLRADMLAGIDPVRRWFTENGIYEEIERRKAAGTWPSG